MANDTYKWADTASPLGGNDPGMPPVERRGLLRRRWNEAKDSFLESAMGKQESWAKKVNNGQSGVLLDDIPKLLEALKLKLVDISTVSVDRDVFEAYRLLATRALNDPKKLTSGEDE